jgi:hypothetical protein
VTAASPSDSDLRCVTTRLRAHHLEDYFQAHGWSRPSGSRGWVHESRDPATTLPLVLGTESETLTPAKLRTIATIEGREVRDVLDDLGELLGDARSDGQKPVCTTARTSADASPTKEQSLTEMLAEHESVFVVLDPRVSGVVVPPHLAKQATLSLQIGLNMAVRIPDLRISPWGFSATLSFNRSPFHCRVPWKAVYALRTDGPEPFGRAWPESVPEEVRVAAARNIAEETAKIFGAVRREPPRSRRERRSGAEAAPDAAPALRPAPRLVETARSGPWTVAETTAPARAEPAARAPEKHSSPSGKRPSLRIVK